MAAQAVLQVEIINPTFLKIAILEDTLVSRGLTGPRSAAEWDNTNISPSRRVPTDLQLSTKGYQLLAINYQLKN